MIDSIQRRAERLAESYPNLGCGLWRFERTGRAQLEALIRNGLNPWSKLLDIGSGALCGAYWMIHFLDAGCYHGIEPNRRMFEAGIANILEPDLLEHKRPCFDHNTEFDFSVFRERFDFVHAHSIWTHASKSQIARMLDGFAEHSSEDGLFLTSFKSPVPVVRPDYKGADWIGASHESEEPGIVRHSLSWIREQCAARGLTVARAERIHKQRYLRIERARR